MRCSHACYSTKRNAGSIELMQCWSGYCFLLRSCRRLDDPVGLTEHYTMEELPKGRGKPASKAEVIGPTLSHRCGQTLARATHLSR